MDKLDLPQDLQKFIGVEMTDFAEYVKVKGKFIAFLFFFGFGLFSILVPVVSIIKILLPLLNGENVKYSVGKQVEIANLQNYEGLFLPGAVMLYFLLISLAIFYFSFTILFEKGRYYVGTPERLITYKDDKIRYYNWDEFSGKTIIEPGGKSLYLEMRRWKSGKTDDPNNSTEKDSFTFSRINNVQQIESLCKQRIAENDPRYI